MNETFIVVQVKRTLNSLSVWLRLVH